MGQTLATMVTMTTYGTWLRGDERGWVEDGVTYPPDPIVEARDRARMKFESFTFDREDLLRIGGWIGRSLIARLDQRILALTVRRWHVHFIVAATDVPIARVVKCAKDAVRYGLRCNRPIWTEHYDKRFCFDQDAALARVRYVQRHNVEAGWPPRPWDFVADCSERPNGRSASRRDSGGSFGGSAPRDSRGAK